MRRMLLFVLVVTTTSSAEVVLLTLVSSNEEEWGRFGYAVSGAGDVNGDGYHDLVVGAIYEDLGSVFEDAGRAYVFDGETGSELYTLMSPDAQENGWFGIDVSIAGDVNGDGCDDIVVGAAGEDLYSGIFNGGRVYVFDGQTGNLLHTLISPSEEASSAFGQSVSGAGDVNGDGFDDVVVGAYMEDPGTSPDDAGRAYVFDGQAGTVLYTLVSPNEEDGGSFGCSVSGAWDVNGDGHGELVIGALWESPGSSPHGAGRAYVFDGVTGNLYQTLVSPNEETFGHFGVSVAGMEDVNGDGYDDVVVGALYENPGSSPEDAGRAYVFDGENGTVLHCLLSPNEEVDGRFGYPVSGAGDVNGDGYDDVLVGGRLVDPESSAYLSGAIFVFDGHGGTVLHTLISPIEGTSGGLERSVSGAGDLNGDGYDDVIVGAQWESTDPSPDGAGRAYVFDCHGVEAEKWSSEAIATEVTLVGPFPNPTTSWARIILRLPERRQGICDLSLYDVTGRLIERVMNRPAHGGETLDIRWSAKSAMSSGLYWWRFSSGGQSVVKSMVIIPY